jgi:hypothetical protein
LFLSSFLLKLKRQLSFAARNRRKLFSSQTKKFLFTNSSQKEERKKESNFLNNATKTHFPEGLKVWMRGERVPSQSYNIGSEDEF